MDIVNVAIVIASTDDDGYGHTFYLLSDKLSTEQKETLRRDASKRFSRSFKGCLHDNV